MRPVQKSAKASSRVLFLLAVLLFLGVYWSIVFVTVQQHGDHLEVSEAAIAPWDSLATTTDTQLQKHLENSERRVKELEEQIAEFERQKANAATIGSTGSTSNSDTVTLPLQKKLTEDLHKAEADLQECRQGQDQATSEQKQQPLVHQNPVCRLLPHPIPHPSALWSLYLPEIHKASQLSNDHRYNFHDFTAQLLQLVSPRLPQSVKTLPRASWPKVDEILRVAHERYDYVTNREAWEKKGQGPPPRPVKVVIMGGSLLVGMNCRKIIKDLGFQLRMPLGDCSWANRLEKVLNQFFLLAAGFGGDTLLSWPQDEREKQLDTHYIVQVTKIAMGGTNTETGTNVLEYDLFPPEAKNPDIIINAYATNDMHITTMLEAQSGNATLRDKIFEMTENFVRLVMDDSDSCQGSLPPLMIHMDDYLGNEQREIFSTTILAQAVQVLASYYGFSSASYGDLVRDIVYGDTREFWFSPEGWYDVTTPTEMQREIHPNMGMHIVAAWVMAYNFLHIITTFCSLEGFNIQQANGMDSGNYQPMDYENTRLNNLPVLNGKYWPKGKPKAPPAGLPPPLKKTLSLEDVSELWQQAAQKSSSKQKNCSSKNDKEGGVKCPFSWLSGISSKITKPEQVKAFFEQSTQLAMGDWSFDNDHGKLGIVAHSVMNPLTLEFDRVTQSIGKITIFYMKSYGPKWANSQVQAQVWKKSPQAKDWELVQQSEFVGYHDKHTSESYTELLDISQTPIEAGASLRLRLTLLDGSTFKIMGIAICS